MIYLRVYIHWNGAAQHQSVDDAAVDVTGHDDLVPALAHRQHHGLYGTGGASYHQESVSRPKGIGSQLLRLPDYGNGMTQVVQGLHAVYINADALFPQKFRQLRVAAARL